jgi:O-acetyl-ADP-ribose deacetylase (regulator of RNase III)
MEEFGSPGGGATQSYKISNSVLHVLIGDIVEQRVDAIVNAANEGLRGGSGVDGAIHRAGGASIMAECRALGHCATGDAVATGAGDLPTRWVIHAVGPIWHGGNDGEPDLLARAYRSSMARARALGVRSIAFPSLSTGAYGYPFERAAPIAIRELVGAARRRRHEIRVVLRTPATLDYFTRVLDAARMASQIAAT